jgi:predicted nucleotide-binding protein (sugar kinase/HSP70/actin superfamily)
VSLAIFDNLLGKHPDYIFMPHVEEMHVVDGETRKEFSATCLFTQGEAFWLTQLYKERNLKDSILSPTLNFARGYETEKDSFIEIGKKLGFGRTRAGEAFDKAIAVQAAYRAEKKELGRKVLKELHDNPKQLAIVLFGPPHNAFNDDTNKGIPKKLTTRGYAVIPFDILPTEKEAIEEPHDDYMHWEIGQKIIRGSQIVKKDNQLFGLYITNFLCAIDSVLVTYFRRIMKQKPSLTLEIDGHTADAGVDTRVEAFIDVVKNYLEVQKKTIQQKHTGYVPARISVENTGIFFIDSKAEKMSLTDPRVKMIIPSMGDFAAEFLSAAFRRAGVRAEAMPVSDKETLRLGRGVTTGKECLPMVLCIGSMLKYLDRRKTKDEKLVVFQPRAAGYCRLGQYHVFMNMLIKERKLEDVAILSLANEERYTGFGPSLMMNAWRALVTGDVMDDIRNTIWTIAEDPDAGEKILNQERDKLVAAMEGSSSVDFYKQMKMSAKVLSEIPLRVPLHDAPEISIMGEIFVRRDAFSNKDIAKRLAEKGFIARTAHISEWLYYLTYMIKNKLHIPNYTFLGWMEFLITDSTQRHMELKMKKILEKSGLYEAEAVNIDDIIKYSEHILPRTLKGEPGMIMGVTLRDTFTKYAGVVNIGPFSCMPVRFTEALAGNNLDMKAKMEAYKAAGIELKENGFKSGDRMPFLTIEADGNPYPQLLEARFESFCLQAGRVAEKQGKKVMARAVVGNKG